jgi:nitrogen regulatory protein PII
VQLVIAVVDEERTEELLAGFLELGVTGATVLQSEGMGRLLANEAPIFAGLEALRRARPRNHTLFSVMADDKVERVMALVREVCGPWTPHAPDRLRRPVSRVEGCRGSWGASWGAHPSAARGAIVPRAGRLRRTSRASPAPGRARARGACGATPSSP